MVAPKKAVVKKAKPLVKSAASKPVVRPAGWKSVFRFPFISK
jgi:hypothetical protein